jgi:hypothetical protein
MLVTRNMTTNGKMPSMVRPTRSKMLGVPGKVGTSFHSRYSRPSSTLGSTSIIPMVRWSCRS